MLWCPTTTVASFSSFSAKLLGVQTSSLPLTTQSFTTLHNSVKILYKTSRGIRVLYPGHTSTCYLWLYGRLAALKSEMEERRCLSEWLSIEKNGYSPSPTCEPFSVWIRIEFALILACSRFASSLLTSGIGSEDIAAIVLHTTRPLRR